MKQTALLFFITILLSATSILSYSQEQGKNFHDFVVKDIDGNDFDLSSLKGKKVLVVNTASECGLTPQYAVLQELYEKLDKNKFEIIGFPANNFLSQEPGSNEDIKEFCTSNYGVTFPMMSKVSVCDYIYKGYPPEPANADTVTTDLIYQWLTKKDLNGFSDYDIKWNFQKFLIDEEGNLVGSLSPGIGAELLYLLQWLED